MSDCFESTRMLSNIEYIKNVVKWCSSIKVSVLKISKMSVIKVVGPKHMCYTGIFNIEWL